MQNGATPTDFPSDFWILNSKSFFIMPYDSSLPADHAPIVAAELRNQLNGLNDLIAAVPGSPAVTDAITSQSAGPVGGLPGFDTNISDPPTQDQVQGIANILSALVAQLQRQ